MSDRPSRSVTPDESRGLLDTSVVIDIEVIDSALLPDETAISVITLAELAAGPHATSDEHERGRRQDRLHWAASRWDPLPLDVEVARAYGRIYATLQGSGRPPPPPLRRSAHRRDGPGAGTAAVYAESRRLHRLGMPHYRQDRVTEGHGLPADSRPAEPAHSIADSMV